MRIIAGRLKNKVINENTVVSTHPMSEKLRGAIFNSLGDVEDLVVLDGCAGTGMVGLEAISRGASRVHFVEKDDRAYSQLQKNIKRLLKPKDEAIAYHSGIRLFLKKQNLPTYDIMVFDPPYDIVQTDHFDNAHRHLAPAGLVVFSLPSSIEPPRFTGLVPLKSKTYGRAQLVYYTHD